MNMQILIGLIACLCFGYGLGGGGVEYVIYSIIFSFFAVFGGEYQNEH